MPPVERSALSDRAGRQARGDFTTEAMQDATLALYDRLLRQPARRAQLSRNDKAPRELTCLRIRRILDFALAGSASATYVYPSATE